MRVILFSWYIICFINVAWFFGPNEHDLRMNHSVNWANFYFIYFGLLYLVLCLYAVSCCLKNRALILKSMKNQGHADIIFFKDNQVLLVYFWKIYTENFNMNTSQWKISSIIKVQSFYHSPVLHRKFLQTTICYLYVKRTYVAKYTHCQKQTYIKRYIQFGFCLILWFL